MNADLPTVLVLAAGAGHRFRASGGIGSKLDAELHGRPLIAHTLDAVRASGLPWHVERGAHPGMGDSIAAAVRATAQAQGGWLILPADLPLIQATTCAEAARRRGGTTVGRDEQRLNYAGHPWMAIRHADDRLFVHFARRPPSCPSPLPPCLLSSKPDRPSTLPARRWP